LFVGRIIPEKGLDILIDAYNNMDYSKATLVVVGSAKWYGDGKQIRGTYTSQLQDKVDKSNKNIKFLDYVSGRDLYTLYSATDIFVCPSRWNEPFGLVVVEAMASENAVIASNVGGIPEIIESGKDGILFSPENSIELSGQLDKLCNEPKIKFKLGKQGRKKVLHYFNWKRVSNELENVFREVFIQ